MRHRSRAIRKYRTALTVFASIAVIALVAIVAGVFGAAKAEDGTGQLRGAYIDSDYFTRLPWGTNSHWIEPWRGYMETTSAATFIDGTGINFNVDVNQTPNVAKMLAKYGIRHARLDINWGSFAYDDENLLEDPSIAMKLKTLERVGIRPLIVLNGNSRQPCPMRSEQRRVVKDARRGDTTLQLDSGEGLVPGFSGLSKLGKSVDAAGVLIVSLDGATATLSKPLPVDLQAGAAVTVATLKYRPFGVPGSADFEQTMLGWQTYVRNVARIARADLGTTGARDGGFDLEIWNELTFGSSFLSIDNYYSPAAGTSPSKNVWGPIVNSTADIAVANPDLFSGVRIGDGFANTIPWRASSAEPARIDAIDKHPYASKLSFPAAEQAASHVGAAYGVDDFVPTYAANFPEYWATGIRADNILRDMAPIESSIGKLRHGRNARSVDGKAAPIPIWITEVNNNPVLDEPSIDDAAARGIKGKAALRYFTFFLNKGVTQLDLYAVNDRSNEFGDKAMSIVDTSFLTYAEQPSQPYPTDDRPFVSPALLWTGRVAAKMADGLDRHLKELRELRIDALAARNDAVIFSGNGSPESPDLRGVDVFTFLPYQVNAHRFVIPYYIMTRDVTATLPTELVSAEISGFAESARYKVFDPVNDRTIPVTSARSHGRTRLELPTTDYPRLLIVNEAAQ